MKETEWYRGDQKPVRVGAYKRKYRDKQRSLLGDWFSWFDGQNFGIAFFTLKACQKHKANCEISLMQNLPWRGVSK
jgi:hypothetical protein